MMNREPLLPSRVTAFLEFPIPRTQIPKGQSQAFSGITLSASVRKEEKLQQLWKWARGGGQAAWWQGRAPQVSLLLHSASLIPHPPLSSLHGHTHLILVPPGLAGKEDKLSHLPTSLLLQENKVFIPYCSWKTESTLPPTPPSQSLCHLQPDQALSVQFSSVTQSCLTLGDPMDCSTPGLHVHHQLLEFTQTHVHWVSDAIKPSHPLLNPSLPTFNLSQHQGLFQWVSFFHQVAKVLDFSISPSNEHSGLMLQHQSFQWTLRTDLL